MRGYSLGKKCEVLYPAQAIYLGYQAVTGEEKITYSTTNGCAAGFDRQDTIIKGVLELVERDAIMAHWLWKKSPRKFSKIPTRVQNAIDEISAGKIKYHFLDLTINTKIPVAAVIIHNKTGCGYTYSIGASCAASAETAITKAFLEAVQGKRNLRLDPEKDKGISKKELTNFEKIIPYYSTEKNFKKIKFLFSNKEEAQNTSKTLSNREILCRVMKISGDLLVFEQTTRDVKQIGLHVIRMVAPGLIQLPVPSTPFLGAPRINQLRDYFNDDTTAINNEPHPFP